MTKANRPHIGIFGRRNNGKSSLINAISGEEIAIVSPQAGTTTDPVQKVVEVLGMGPTYFIDTAGIDDTGELGQKRIAKTIDVIKKVDLAIVVITDNSFGDYEIDIIDRLKKHHTPFFLLHNKSDIATMDSQFTEGLVDRYGVEIIEFSALKKTNFDQLISLIKKLTPESAYKKKTILGDLISYGDLVVLVTPVDIEAPEGRLILPQVQTIRDILDNDAVCVVVKERELDSFLTMIKNPPALVVTDSQEFLKVDASVDRSIPLTSFSILFARLKGDFSAYIEGTPALSKLKENDNVLILESCTHQVTCDDIGRVKIPRWLTNYVGEKLNYDVVSGFDNLPKPIEEYAIVIQCGGCVLTGKQLANRLKPAIDARISVTNYGMAISYIHGIYDRAIAPFVGAGNSERYL